LKTARRYFSANRQISTTYFAPKDQWAHQRNAYRQTVFAEGKYWERPKKGHAMFALSPLATKKPFPKRFLRSFFLKKATLGAAAPPMKSLTIK